MKFTTQKDICCFKMLYDINQIVPSNVIIVKLIEENI